MYYVYIIYSKNFDVYYKGFSENVAQRLLYHNENRSRYTSNKGIWELVYSKAFLNRKAFFYGQKVNFKTKLFCFAKQLQETIPETSHKSKTS
jgi:predicted GIY-YIG superfamily endonuclease